MQNDSDLDAEALKELVAEFKAEIKDEEGRRLPQRSVTSSCAGAIMAVFNSLGERPRRCSTAG